MRKLEIRNNALEKGTKLALDCVLKRNRNSYWKELIADNGEYYR